VFLRFCGWLLAAAAVCSPAIPAQTHDARDAWQEPERVMDALGVHPGSRVADIGCGEGYFTVRLARRVAPQGAVYAVDIDEDALGKLRRRVQQEELRNVEIIRGIKDDPLLPPGALDAVLIVNAYHEMTEYNAMLRHIRAVLKPGGLLAIIDAPGNEADSRAEHQRKHTISRKMVREDAERNGFLFRSEEPGFGIPGASIAEGSRGKWFFLIFETP